MRKLMLSIFGLFAAAGGVAVAISGEAESQHAVLIADEMGQVIGGAQCEACFNYCGGSGCQSSRCANDGSDNGEICGSSGTGSGAAWTCAAWGSPSDNCTLSGSSANCLGKVCYCDSIGDCWADDETTHTGRYSCSN